MQSKINKFTKPLSVFEPSYIRFWTFVKAKLTRKYFKINHKTLALKFFEFFKIHVVAKNF